MSKNLITDTESYPLFLPYWKDDITTNKKRRRSVDNESSDESMSEPFIETIHCSVKDQLHKPLKKRRRTYDQEKIEYLESFNASKYGELHEQSFVKANIRRFHQRQRSYSLLVCQQCHTRWFPDTNYSYVLFTLIYFFFII